jgi:hypothetical protein
MAALAQDHKTDEWRLFVDSSKHISKGNSSSQWQQAFLHTNCLCSEHEGNVQTREKPA